MPFPARYSDEEMLAAREEHGSNQKAALALGLNRRTFDHHMSRIQAQENLDPAVKGGMAAIGTGLVPKLAWIKTKPKDGEPGYSFMVKPEQAPENIAERIRSALEGMEPAEPIPAPQETLSSLLTLYPIADRHNGMRAWGRETGEDYDSAIASERLTTWMGRCIAASPASETAVIVDIGDGEHMDDATNATPKSKHVLDVDTRVFMTLETSVESLSSCVNMALKKHKRVIVRILPGNHNPTLYLAVMFALAERYREEPRVEVQKVPGEYWVHQFGLCLLAAHHGDKAKASQLVMFLADEYAAVWGKTRHRFLFTGHLHHHKSQDVGGVQWEQLRAITARDAYAVSHAYSARAQLQAITYHRERGEIQRVKVGI